MCFKTIEGLEVLNILIYGTRDFAQYPIGIYNLHFHILRTGTFVVAKPFIKY